MDWTNLTQNNSILMADTSPISLNETGGNSDRSLQIISHLEVVFYRSILPCICIIGLCGNSMALLLIRTNFHLKRLPSNVYLSALSVASSLFLGTVLLMWFETVTSLKIYHGRLFGCKFLTYIAHFCDFACIWMILCVCTDRAFLLYWPKWRKKVLNLRAAQLCTAAIIAVGLVINLWCLVVANLIPHRNNRTRCAFFKEDYDIYLIFHTFDTVISIGIPSFLICFVNAVAVVRYRNYRKFQSMTPTVRFRNSSVNSYTMDNNLLVAATENGARTSTTCVTTTKQPRNRTDPKRPLRPADLQLTRTVLILTTTFLALNCPSYALRVIYAFVEDDIFTKIIEEWIQLIAYIMYYSHFAILFFLYTFFSPQMKKELKPTALKLLECYCFKTVPDFGYDDSDSRRRQARQGNNS